MRLGLISVAILSLGAIVAFADVTIEMMTYDFEKSTVGKMPAGWTATKTGTGEGSVWKIVEVKTAPIGSERSRADRRQPEFRLQHLRGR